MESLNEWMDERKMTAEEASELFAKSPGTIRNWRSIGVPDSQVAWVEKRMAEHDAKQSVSLPNRIVLEPSRAQFRTWNRAALMAGQLIDDWASAALDDAAVEDEANQTGSDAPFNPLQSLAKVAEPETDYLPKKGNGG